MFSKVFIINGYPKSGKDTFVTLVTETLNSIDNSFKVHNISTVDTLVKISQEYFGYSPENKTDKNRSFLKEFKELVDRYYDYTTTYVTNKVMEISKEDTHNNIIFIHCREPEKIDKLKKLLKAKTIIIDNPNITHIADNSSDQNVNNYSYDYHVVNDIMNDNMVTYRKTVEKFVKTHILK